MATKTDQAAEVTLGGGTAGGESTFYTTQGAWSHCGDPDATVYDVSFGQIKQYNIVTGNFSGESDTDSNTNISTPQVCPQETTSLATLNKLKIPSTKCHSWNPTSQCMPIWRSWSMKDMSMSKQSLCHQTKPSQQLDSLMASPKSSPMQSPTTNPLKKDPQLYTPLQETSQVVLSKTSTQDQESMFKKISPRMECFLQQSTQPQPDHLESSKVKQLEQVVQKPQALEVSDIKSNTYATLKIPSTKCHSWNPTSQCMPIWRSWSMKDMSMSKQSLCHQTKPSQQLDSLMASPKSSPMQSPTTNPLKKDPQLYTPLQETSQVVLSKTSTQDQESMFKKISPRMECFLQQSTQPQPDHLESSKVKQLEQVVQKPQALEVSDIKSNTYATLKKSTIIQPPQTLGLDLVQFPVEKMVPMLTPSGGEVLSDNGKSICQQDLSCPMDFRSLKSPSLTSRSSSLESLLVTESQEVKTSPMDLDPSFVNCQEHCPISLSQNVKKLPFSRHLAVTVTPNQPTEKDLDLILSVIEDYEHIVSFHNTLSPHYHIYIRFVHAVRPLTFYTKFKDVIDCVLYIKPVKVRAAYIQYITKSKNSLQTVLSNTCSSQTLGGGLQKVPAAKPKVNQTMAKKIQTAILETENLEEVMFEYPQTPFSKIIQIAQTCSQRIRRKNPICVQFVHGAAGSGKS